ncbi:SDR family NAD(P)-dependent oxidoreductase [Roseixanthobacter pseudopolyaromaticivorans]|uniref:SDR family NAD(P)-dependent oxidoreductase n=1 Tax=Xanthobacteraceae TaxID=335928 RepID=UPI0037269A89
MDLALTGRTAIVTGGSRGIGFAIAARLLAEGARVAICGRDPARLEAAAERLRASCGDAVEEAVLAVAADTSVSADRDRLVEATLERFGRVDILVNNAGTHVRATVDDMTDAQLQGQLDDKLFGFLGMIRAVLPGMRARGDGRVVNIIGQATRHPHPDRLPSGIANAAAQAMSKALADALARENIRINTVCPQYIETDILAGVIAKEMADRNLDRASAASGFTRANVLGRLGTAEEVADLVAFLVSDRADHVSGSSVSIDGGYHRHVFG